MKGSRRNHHAVTGHMRIITVQVAHESDLQSIDGVLRRHGLRPVGETWLPVPVDAPRRIVFSFTTGDEGARAFALLAKFLPRITK
jgi:hypothetical protein